MSGGFTTAAALVHELMEARDDRRLLNLQRQLARLKLLIIDELGFVPRSTTGAELLFEVFSQRYERGSVLVTPTCPLTNGLTCSVLSGLPGRCWTASPTTSTSWRMNGDSYRPQGQPAGRCFPVSRLLRRRLARTRTAPPYPRSLPAAGHFP